MARSKAVSKPPASVREQRPRLQAEANLTNNRVDELDAQDRWLAHIAAGRIAVR